jgi:hypothetical protein
LHKVQVSWFANPQESLPGNAANTLGPFEVIKSDEFPYLGKLFSIFRAAEMTNIPPTLPIVNYFSLSALPYKQKEIITIACRPNILLWLSFMFGSPPAPCF